jgi:hypothetical protein
MSDVSSQTQAEERRHCPRIPADQSASMRLVDSWSQTRREIRVLDISKRGLKLRVPTFLDRGTLMQIHLQGLESAGLSPESLLAVGEVRYCLKTGQAFQVGVRFREVFPED